MLSLSSKDLLRSRPLFDLFSSEFEMNGPDWRYENHALQKSELEDSWDLVPR